MALSDDILDATIRHSVYLERHKASVIRQIIGLIGDVNDDVVAQIIKAKIDGMPRRHVDQLLANLRRTIKDGYSPVITVLDDEIRALGIQEARFQKRMLENTIPIRLTFDIPADEQIYAAATARPFEGRLLDEWYRGLPDGAFRRVQDAIRMGYVEGRTTAQIVQDIRGTRTQAGIIEQSKRGAEAAVRTALAHTANVAKEEVYKRNRSKIKGIEWVSTLDGRTSAICRGFDGKVFPVNEGPRPPAHVNCRSTTIPVIKHARNFSKAALATTRASMNGQVSSELNYDEWLRRQPISFQDDVLGPTKGKLFRAGLKMDRFIDRKGAELTLKQIEEREADIWAKAFGGTPKPTPQPRARPAPEPTPEPKGPVFTWQDIPEPKNASEALAMAMEHVAESASFLKGSSPKGIHISVMAAKEVMERFGLGKINYMGARQNAPLRYKNSKTAMQAFDMRNDNYLVQPKGFDVERVARDMTGSAASSRKFHEIAKSTVEKSQLISDEVRRRFAKTTELPWSVSTDVRQVTHHEMGHRLHGKFLEELNTILHSNHVQVEGWSRLVSQYAGTNTKEYIAETFALYMQGDESQFFRIHPEVLKFYRQKDVLG